MHIFWSMKFRVNVGWLKLCYKYCRQHSCCKALKVKKLFPHFLTLLFIFISSNLSSSHPYASVVGPHLICRSFLVVACCTDIAIDVVPVQGSVAELSSEVARVVCVE